MNKEQHDKLLRAAHEIVDVVEQLTADDVGHLADCIRDLSAALNYLASAKLVEEDPLGPDPDAPNYENHSDCKHDAGVYPDALDYPRCRICNERVREDFLCEWCRQPSRERRRTGGILVCMDCKNTFIETGHFPERKKDGRCQEEEGGAAN